MNEANFDQSAVIEKIETLRQQLTRRRNIYIALGIALAVAVVLAAVWLYPQTTQLEGEEAKIGKIFRRWLWVGVLLALGGCFKLITSSNTLAQEYSTKAKKLLDQASNELLPERLSLHSGLGLDIELIKQSLLIETRKIDYIHSAGLLQGEIEGLGFQSAQVEIGYHERGLMEKSVHAEMMMFASHYLPYHIGATVLVVDDWAQKGLGKFLGGFLQQLNHEKGLKVHHLQHEPDFEKEFAVYTNEPEEAERLLSAPLCKFLLDNAKAGHRFSLHFRPAGVLLMLKSESIIDTFPLDIKAGDYIPQRIMENLNKRVKTAQIVAKKLKNHLS